MRTLMFISLLSLICTFISCKKDDSLPKPLIINTIINAKNGGGSTVNLSKDLLAYYPFDGNAKDLSGNGYDGVNDGATNTTNRFGQKNRAFNFNNNNVTVNLSNTSFQNDFTISFWVLSGINTQPYPTVVNGENNYLVIQYATNFSNINYVSLYFLDQIRGVYGNLLAVVDKSKWNNIVYVSKDGYLSLFINGTFINTLGPISNQSNLTGNYIIIGNGNELPQETFIGKLDDCRIYIRALNQDEITYLAKN